jgi:hypothetical protein
MSGGTYPKRKIFINYRHIDHPDFVERLRDWFALRYGRDSVFMDFDTIPPFTRFADHIRKRVTECDVLVAVIGPLWLDLLRERIDHPEDDYVRLEIVQALQEGKLIAPICIKGARVPRSSELPPDLRPMLDYNVAHLNSGRAFLDSIENTLDALEQQMATLDGLRLITHDMQTAVLSGVNIRLAIEQFQVAADQHDWTAALNWLEQIRASEYMPRFYPIDDYEREIREAMAQEAVERDYDIIRLMADRARKKREDRHKVWDALQTFWNAHPDYDPEELGLEFCPEPLVKPDERPRLQLEPVQDFDPSILDQLDSVDREQADAMFAPDLLAEIASAAADLDALLKPSFEDVQGLLPDELTE